MPFFKDSKEAVSHEATSSEEGNVSDGRGSTADHIFSDPSIADYWRKKYEAAKYENRHRFDPSYTWTAQEERKLVRKVSVYRLSQLGKNLKLYSILLTVVDWSRLIGKLLSGLGSCFVPSTCTGETLTVPSLITW